MLRTRPTVRRPPYEDHTLTQTSHMIIALLFRNEKSLLKPNPTSTLEYGLTRTEHVTSHAEANTVLSTFPFEVLLSTITLI